MESFARQDWPTFSLLWGGGGGEGKRAGITIIRHNFFDISRPQCTSGECLPKLLRCLTCKGRRKCRNSFSSCNHSALVVKSCFRFATKKFSDTKTSCTLSEFQDALSILLIVSEKFSSIFLYFAAFHLPNFRLYSANVYTYTYMEIICVYIIALHKLASSFKYLFSFLKCLRQQIFFFLESPESPQKRGREGGGGGRNMFGRKSIVPPFILATNTFLEGLEGLDLLNCEISL